MQISERTFHVYHHVRPDTGQVFYVGKGKGRRAFDKGARRGQFWHRVVKKAGGVLVEVIAQRLTEDEAFLLEKKNIAAFRKQRVRLCNLTDGGDGTSGIRRTEAWKRMMSQVHSGKVIPEDVREKISASVKTSGFVHTDEMRKKMSETHKGQKRALGYKHTDEWKAQQSIRAAGNKTRFFLGRVRSEEDRAKASASLSGRVQVKIECPHCGKVGGNAMRRWHFENCKSNGDSK
jgi:hypothetical protein